MFSMNLHSMKMTWEENTWGRNYRVRKFWYESSVFEIPGEKYTVNPWPALVVSTYCERPGAICWWCWQRDGFGMHMLSAVSECSSLQWESIGCEEQLKSPSSSLSRVSTARWRRWWRHPPRRRTNFTQSGEPSSCHQRAQKKCDPSSMCSFTVPGLELPEPYSTPLMKYIFKSS